jgi:hypothetical protein
MANLTDLPFEILELIASNLSKYAMKSFSLVSRKCRAVSEPHMFRTIEITYSEFDFTVLEELSRSPLAAYVKILHYDASELFDPGVSHTPKLKVVSHAYTHPQSSRTGIISPLAYILQRSMQKTTQTFVGISEATALLIKKSMLIFKALLSTSRLSWRKGKISVPLRKASLA